MSTPQEAQNHIIRGSLCVHTMCFVGEHCFSWWADGEESLREIS